MRVAGQCEYCRSYDHGEMECPVVRNDRRAERMVGCILVTLLSPFAAAGMLAGLASGAFVAAFKWALGGWGDIIKLVRRKNGPPDAEA